MSKENLIEILEARKKYIQENYTEKDKHIALFEINTLMKCVNKAYGTAETRKPVRRAKKVKRKQIKNKGLFV